MATLVKLKVSIAYSPVGKVAEDMPYNASLHKILNKKIMSI